MQCCCRCRLATCKPIICSRLLQGGARCTFPVCIKVACAYAMHMCMKHVHVHVYVCTCTTCTCTCKHARTCTCTCACACAWCTPTVIGVCPVRTVYDSSHLPRTRTHPLPRRPTTPGHAPFTCMQRKSSFTPLARSSLARATNRASLASSPWPSIVRRASAEQLCVRARPPSTVSCGPCDARGVVAGWDAARDAQLAEARAVCCEGAERRVCDAGAFVR